MNILDQNLSFDFFKDSFDCAKDYSSTNSKLKKKILCDYDKSIGPTAKLINVDFSYLLKSFDFVSFQNVQEKFVVNKIFFSTTTQELSRFSHILQEFGLMSV